MIKQLIKTVVVGACLMGFWLMPEWSRANETYVIDPQHSSISFRIKHLGITFVSGVIPNAGGVYTFDNAHIDNASIWVKVRVVDIDTGNEKRDQHLRSPDFFDEKRYPCIIFKSKSIAADSDDEYLVAGELSLHGETKEVTVRALKTDVSRGPGGEYRSGFETRFSINRSDFGMQYLALMADKVDLFVSVQGVRIDSSRLSSSGMDATFRLECE